MFSWNDGTPPEGVPLLVKSDRVTVAFYCDGGFYTLRMDNVLGVLRKTFVEAEGWAYIPGLSPDSGYCL